MSTTTQQVARPVIEVRGLVKTFGLLPVLRQIDLDVPRGQFLALLGPNGSGKSTLLRLIAGLSRPTAGVIRVGGWALPRQAERVRPQIGLVSHKALLYENLTAYENLRFFARLYNLPRAEQHTHVFAMLDRVGLKKRAYDLVRTFSRGMLQRLTIARALLHNPAVLLFDEPFTGLDQSAAATLDALLEDAHDGQRTLLLTTHQLDRAAHLADRVVILNRGRVVFDEPAAAIADLPTAYTQVTEMVTSR